MDEGILNHAQPSDSVVNAKTGAASKKLKIIFLFRGQNEAKSNISPVFKIEMLLSLYYIAF